MNDNVVPFPGGQVDGSRLVDGVLRDREASVSLLTVRGAYIDAPGSYEYAGRVFPGVFPGAFPGVGGDPVRWLDGAGAPAEVKDGDILRPFTNWFAWYRKVL